MRMADRLVEDGYRDVGYEYVNIDDCWSLLERDNVTGKLVADPVRFPSGIAALAEYVRLLDRVRKESEETSTEER